MGIWLAEVIAIGDELISGQRLDTNSRWISQQLEELGIRTAFHSTVGDDLERKRHVFEVAVRRANIVICSGGLGPTADDLTREVIAQTAGVPLIRDQNVVEHIQAMYRSRDRVMPDNNLCQADFPEGAVVIDNPEGTAPGIDFRFSTDSNSDAINALGGCRIFALPGVPAELKQMWEATVDPALRSLTGAQSIIRHHSLHVFGEGESQIETLLPDLVRRGNDPSVGITASAATITLRVSTAGDDAAHCQNKMLPVLDTIRDCLGDMVFGENGQTLAGVVMEQLAAQDQTVALIDSGLRGEVAGALAAVSTAEQTLVEAKWVPGSLFGQADDAIKNAIRLRNETSADFCVAISPIDRTEALVNQGKSKFAVAVVGPAGEETQSYIFRGHSDWRQQRAVKQVLNQLRLLIRRGS